MKKIIYCSSFYEKGRIFIDDFFRSLLNINNKFFDKITLNIVIDDLLDAKNALEKFKNKVNINLTYVSKKHTITEIRNILIKNACMLNGDILIFIDMDDLLLENNLIAHREALEHADISFGDMSIVDKNGDFLNKNLFDKTRLPNLIKDYKPLLTGNFMGLSNTAIRKNVLEKNFIEIPSHLVATDWWLYTMLLLKGCIAKKTKYKVASYRQHANNVLGYRNNNQLDAFLKTCKIAKEHFLSLPNLLDFKNAVTKITIVEEFALKNPSIVLKSLNKKKNFKNVWFSEIFSTYKDIDK